jgi:hypothetical protein
MPTFVNGEVEGTEIREICWQAASTSSCDIRCQRFPTRGKMRACCFANAFRVHLKGRPPGSANASAIQRTMPERPLIKATLLPNGAMAAIPVGPRSPVLLFRPKDPAVDRGRENPDLL